MNIYLKYSILLLCCLSVSHSHQLYSMNHFLKIPQFILQRFINHNIEDKECASDLKTFVEDLFKFQLWTIEMIDSCGKLNSGILSGNYHHFGDYDKCLSINKVSKKKIIQCQYCTMYVVPDNNLINTSYPFVKRVVDNNLNEKLYEQFMKIKEYRASFGICIPKSCSVTTLKRLFTKIKNTIKITSVHIIFEEKMCLYKNKLSTSDPWDFWIYAFFVTIFLIVLTSTVYDVYFKNGKRALDVFTTLSIIKNLKKFFCCKNKPKKQYLSCIDGMRVIFMIWVILGHTAWIKTFTAISIAVHLYKQYETSIENAVLMATHYSLDTFLLISGILVIYNNLTIYRTKRFNLKKFYGKRFLKTTSLLLVTILAYKSVTKHISEGPLWPDVLSKVMNTFSLSSLLYTSNFYLHDNICLIPSWYLSLEAQMFVLTPLFLHSFKKDSRKALMAIGTVCLLSFIYTSYIINEQNIGFLFKWEVLDENEALLVHQNPLCRMPPYLIGVCFGYFLHEAKNKTIKISPTVNVLLWAAAIITMLSLVLHHTTLLKYENTVFRSIFLNVVSRSVWALAVGFIIFSCATGHGGVFNTLLSHRYLRIFSKLLYSMFLVHFLFLFVYLMNNRSSQYISTFSLMVDGCVILTLTVTSSVILHLTFEAPTSSLIAYFENTYNHKATKQKRM